MRSQRQCYSLEDLKNIDHLFLKSPFQSKEDLLDIKRPRNSSVSEKTNTFKEQTNSMSQLLNPEMPMQRQEQYPDEIIEMLPLENPPTPPPLLAMTKISMDTSTSDSQSRIFNMCSPLMEKAHRKYDKHRKAKLSRQQAEATPPWFKENDSSKLDSPIFSWNQGFDDSKEVHRSETVNVISYMTSPTIADRNDSSKGCEFGDYRILLPLPKSVTLPGFFDDVTSLSPIHQTPFSISPNQRYRGQYLNCHIESGVFEEGMEQMSCDSNDVWVTAVEIDQKSPDRPPKKHRLSKKDSLLERMVSADDFYSSIPTFV